MYSLSPEKSAEFQGIAASNFGLAAGFFGKAVEAVGFRREGKGMGRFLGEGGRFVEYADRNLLGRKRIARGWPPKPAKPPPRGKARPLQDRRASKRDKVYNFWAEELCKLLLAEGTKKG